MASRSPTVATPLPKSSTAPETPSKDATPSPQTVPFPPPQTFEVIPPLHGILLRLLSQKGTSGGTAGGAPGATTEPAQQPLSAGANNGNTAPSLAPLDATAHPPLDVKDIPTATSSVKIRIQKARTVVEALPDVHRSVAEQQKEIDELVDRVARLRTVVADFGSRAGAKHTDTVKMES